MEDIFGIFNDYWRRYRDGYDLVYKDDESWDSLASLGVDLLKSFLTGWILQGIAPILNEKRLSYETDGWRYSSQPDCVGDNNDCYVYVEVKTTEENIPKIWVRTSDQLTGGAMCTQHTFMTDKPVNIVVCNFVKETGSVEWIKSVRTKEDIEEYKRKIDWFVEQSQSGYYPKRSLYAFNSPCTWCEFTETCLGKEKPVEDSLQKELESLTL